MYVYTCIYIYIMCVSKQEDPQHGSPVSFGFLFKQPRHHENPELRKCLQAVTSQFPAKLAMVLRDHVQVPGLSSQLQHDASRHVKNDESCVGVGNLLVENQL